MACVGGSTGDLPLVAAPRTPLPTRPSAEVLVPVSPTALAGAPGDTTVVQVRATRGDGTPVHAVTIYFQVQAGGGAVQPLSATTDGDGLAATKWTFGGSPGVNLLNVVGGFVASSISFTASTAAAQ